MRVAMRLPPICWRMAMISAQSRNSWATKTSVQQCATHTCCSAAAKGFAARSTHDEEDWPESASQQLPVAFFTLCPSRLDLLHGLQHQLCGMGQETREHAEHIGAVPELLPRKGPKLLIGRRIE
jgi:hypothetical protein